MTLWGKKGLSILIVLSASIILPVFSYAFPLGNNFPVSEQNPVAGFFRPTDMHLRPLPLPIWQDPEFIKDNNLTEEQIFQIKETDFTFREKGIALQFQIENVVLQLDRAISTEPIDRSIVLGLAQQVADYRSQLFVHMTKFKLAVETILTVDQLTKFRAKYPPRFVYLHSESFFSKEMEPPFTY